MPQISKVNVDGVDKVLLVNNKTVHIPSSSPTGKINITTTEEVNVAQYATAQVVDSNLVAANIAQGVQILGITGTHQGGSGVPISLAVTYPAGATCTCSCNGTTLTAVGTSGSYTFNIPFAGTWTVTAIGDSTVTASIAIIANYELNVGLPAGYTRVNYIQSSGTQYIDTGLTPKDIYSIELDTIVTNTPGNWGCLFGSQGDYLYGAESFIITYSSNFRFRCGGGSNEISMLSFSLDQRYSMYCDKSMEFKVDGISQGTNTPGETNEYYNIFLFANNAEGNPDQGTSQKLYGFKMYDSNSNLLRDFIPCYRNSDTKPGLYDIINRHFYTNAGDGEFTYG